MNKWVYDCALLYSLLRFFAFAFEGDPDCWLSLVARQEIWSSAVSDGSSRYACFRTMQPARRMGRKQAAAGVGRGW